MPECAGADLDLTPSPTLWLGRVFADHVADVLAAEAPGVRAGEAEVLRDAGRRSMDLLGRTSAVYHNAEHTMLACLAGQQMLRGRLVREGVSADTWRDVMLALMVHDIGYVRGACREDTVTAVAIDDGPTPFVPPRGASDAVLAPWHVWRAIRHVRQTYARTPHLDAERIALLVGATQFPPQPDSSSSDPDAILVQAADLVGQLGDPLYRRKAHALFAEMVETGLADRLGYRTKADLLDGLPAFYRAEIEPLVAPALPLLEATPEGRAWCARMEENTACATRAPASP